MAVMEIEQEVAVRGIGVEADFGTQKLARRVGDVLPQQVARALDLGLADCADDRVRVRRVDGVVDPDLGALAEVGEAVDGVAVGQHPDVDREALGTEGLGLGGAEPVDGLAGDLQRQVELGVEPRRSKRPH